MSGGEYLLGLILIITGLAISDMVSCLHGLLVARQRVRWDWLTVLAAAYIFLMIVNSWGLSFQTYNSGDVNPPLWQFLELLGQIIPLYLAARAIFPDAVSGEAMSLATHYQTISRYFWGAIATTLILYLVGNMVQSGAWLPALAERAGAAAQLLLMVPLVVFADRRLHAVLVPMIVAIFCYDHVTAPMFG